MAVTSTLRQRARVGNARMNIVDIELENETYADGGIEIPPSRLGLTLPYAVIPAPAGGFVFEWDHQANKLKAFTFATDIGYNIPSILGASEDAGKADADANPADVVNGDYIIPYVSAGDNEWEHDAVNQPDVARSVVITVFNPTSDPVAGPAAMTFTVTGTFRGATQTEDIVFTWDNTAKRAVGAGKYRFKTGKKAFDTIDDVSLDTTGAAAVSESLEIGVGLSCWIGLHGGVEAHANVKSIRAGTTDLSHGNDQVDATGNTCLVKDSNAAAKLTDGKAVRIVYTPQVAFGDISDANPKEIQDDVPLTTTVRAMAIGI